ncbi:hypothetical protein LCGC14_0971110 [marine sediment metagenome]|uniref:Uncharacterized protein n=1 Tax=marine sediment metagenome TaxID=412755 RepID=A0A0F9QUT6_9ZZZZ
MVMAASEGAVAGMVSTIPVVVTGGVLLKFAEVMTPKGQQAQGIYSKGGRRKRRPADVYNRNYSGQFSNVGF